MGTGGSAASLVYFACHLALNCQWLWICLQFYSQQITTRIANHSASLELVVVLVVWRLDGFPFPLQEPGIQVPKAPIRTANSGKKKPTKIGKHPLSPQRPSRLAVQHPRAALPLRCWWPDSSSTASWARRKPFFFNQSSLRLDLGEDPLSPYMLFRAKPLESGLANPSRTTS